MQETLVDLPMMDLQRHYDIFWESHTTTPVSKRSSSSFSASLDSESEYLPSTGTSRHTSNSRDSPIAHRLRERTVGDTTFNMDQGAEDSSDDEEEPGRLAALVGVHPRDDQGEEEVLSDDSSVEDLVDAGDRLESDASQNPFVLRVAVQNV